MNVFFLAGIACAVLFLTALFFLLYALSTYCYPQSRTTVALYPEGVHVPRRWGPILLQAVISIVAGGTGVALFSIVFMPEISAKVRADQLADAEGITRDTFKSKLGQAPKVVNFEGDDPRNGLEKILRTGWEIKGTATLDDDTVWDVTVRKAGIDLTCDARRRDR